MLFKKSEPKRHSLTTVLTVTSLAAVGAYSIGCCGKKLIKGVFEKMKGLFGDTSECVGEAMSDCASDLGRKIDKMSK